VGPLAHLALAAVYEELRHLLDGRLAIGRFAWGARGDEKPVGFSVRSGAIIFGSDNEIRVAIPVEVCRHHEIVRICSQSQWAAWQPHGREPLAWTAKSRVGTFRMVVSPCIRQKILIIP